VVVDDHSSTDLPSVSPAREADEPEPTSLPVIDVSILDLAEGRNSEQVDFGLAYVQAEVASGYPRWQRPVECPGVNDTVVVVAAVHSSLSDGERIPVLAGLVRKQCEGEGRFGGDVEGSRGSKHARRIAPRSSGTSGGIVVDLRCNRQGIAGPSR